MFIKRLVLAFSYLILIFINPCTLRAQDSTFYGLLENYDVKFYFLDLEVSNVTIELEGKVTILAELTKSDVDSVAFEIIQEVTLDSIWLDGILTEYKHTNDFARFEIPVGYNNNDLFEVTFFYKLDDIEGNTRLGIFNKQSGAGDFVTYTLSEPYFSNTWFPCKQVLSDKADSVYVFLTMADSLMAGSNGLLTEIVDLGNGKKRYEWKSNYITTYYLISFSVAKYMDYSFMASLANGDSVLVQNYLYIDSGYFQENKENIDATADMMEVFSESMGTYPFYLEKYGHCLAPVGGGMEHQTMTTLGNFSFTLVAHELAHQWFGNYVTCADWQNIWINEGFASYCEFIALERLQSKEDEMSWLSHAHYLAMSSPEGSVFVPADEVDNPSRIFDYPLSYRKGASIIHMIRHEIGDDEVFFDVLEHFLDVYSDSVATAEEFRATLEEYTQMGFETFFQQWFYGAGHPRLDVSWEQRNDSLILNVNQTVTTPEKTPFFNLLIDFKIDFLDGDTIIQFRQESQSEVFRIPFENRIFRVTPDPDEWLIREIANVQRIISDTSSLFHLFPNPASDEIYIENYNIGSPFNVKIYNINGVLVKEVDEKDAFSVIGVSDLVPGVYEVLVTTDERKENFKLSKL